MTTHTTRARVIQLWFSVLAMLAAAWITLGPGMSLGTGALILVVSLVPPAIVLMLWPGVQPLTAGEVIRGK